MVFKSVEFDAVAPMDGSVEGDFVLRQGKYFEIGDYPDKGFSLNEQEADAAVDRFAGAPINLEHTATLLDGKLGRVQRIWRTGRDLLAEYAIPRWLHRVTNGEPIKISSEWDRSSKMPIGAALVLSPRIEDAVMMAAFREEMICSYGRRPDGAGKESRPMSLLARFTAFLRGEGLIEDGEGAANGETELTTEGASLDPPRSSLAFSATPEFKQMAAAIKDQEGIIAGLRAKFEEEQSKATFVSHNNAIDDLVRMGKVTAGEADQWRKVAETYPAAFAAVLETLQARPTLAQFADPATKPTHRITPDPDEAAGKLIALTKQRSKETGERYETAFSAVCRENPVLAAAHASAAPSYSRE